MYPTAFDTHKAQFNDGVQSNNGANISLKALFLLKNSLSKNTKKNPIISNNT